MHSQSDSPQKKAVIKRRVILILALVVILPGLALAIKSFMEKRPDNLGVHDGQLADCPDSPNCVSTQSTTDQHAIEPLRYEGTAAEAMQRLQALSHH